MQNKFKGFRNFLKEKGYYIALLLCTAVVGVTGYSLLKNKEPAKTTDPTTGSKPTVQTRTDTTAPSDNKPAVNMEEGQEATVASTETKAPFRLQKPVSGEILKDAAVDHLAYNPTTRDWRTHEGMDLEAELSAPVYAAAEGTVYTIYEDEQLGMTVVLHHQEGYSTHYSNLAEDIPVSVGQKLSAGEVLGTVGQTACVEQGTPSHVHFAVYQNSEALDPADFLP